MNKEKNEFNDKFVDSKAYAINDLLFIFSIFKVS